MKKLEKYTMELRFVVLSGTVLSFILGIFWLAFLSPKVQAQIDSTLTPYVADTTKTLEKIDSRVDTLEGNFQYIMGKLDAIADKLDAE